MSQYKEEHKRMLKSHINMLETLYKRTTRPSLKLRKELAERMGLTQRKIQIWFQNRRAKENLEIKNNLSRMDFGSSSSSNSPNSSSENNLQILNENPYAKDVLSHYWASTMNTSDLCCYIRKLDVDNNSSRLEVWTNDGLANDENECAQRCSDSTDCKTCVKPDCDAKIPVDGPDPCK